MIVDGWARTGDKGYYDDNENLFIIGRYKELIKYRMAHVIINFPEYFLCKFYFVDDICALVSRWCRRTSRNIC